MDVAMPKASAFAYVDGSYSLLTAKQSSHSRRELPRQARIMLPMEFEPVNILPHVTDRQAFRMWLEQHHATERECWVATRRGRPTGDEAFWYLDAVEEALCFGWVDSVWKVVDGTPLQRFSPRKPRSPWTELNKERVRRLEKLGLMTDAGRAVLPPMVPRSFKVDPDVAAALKAARCWSKFRSLPPLYQRVRAYNVAFYKGKGPRGIREGPGQPDRPHEARRDVWRVE